jgi:hypothetical protein
MSISSSLILHSSLLLMSFLFKGIEPIAPHHQSISIISSIFSPIRPNPDHPLSTFTVSNVSRRNPKASFTPNNPISTANNPNCKPHNPISTPDNSIVTPNNSISTPNILNSIFSIPIVTRAFRHLGESLTPNNRSTSKYDRAH